MKSREKVTARQAIVKAALTSSFIVSYSRISLILSVVLSDTLAGCVEDVCMLTAA